MDIGLDEGVNLVLVHKLSARGKKDSNYAGYLLVENQIPKTSDWLNLYL
jgi:hypothetical protein